MEGPTTFPTCKRPATKILDRGGEGRKKMAPLCSSKHYITRVVGETHSRTHTVWRWLASTYYTTVYYYLISGFMAPITLSCFVPLAEDEDLFWESLFPCALIPSTVDTRRLSSRYVALL